MYNGDSLLVQNGGADEMLRLQAGSTQPRRATVGTPGHAPAPST